MKKSVRNSERCIPGTTNQLLQSEIGREFDGYQTSAGRVLELIIYRHTFNIGYLRGGQIAPPF